MRYILFLLIVISLGSCDSAEQLSEELWYDREAGNWFEALPLGNGRLGAMVYGRVEEEQLQLNEESLWAGCPEDPYPDDIRKHYARFQKLNLENRYDEALEYALEHLAVSPTSIRSYTTLGDLFIGFDHTRPENYRRSLNLEKGIATVEYEIDGNRYIRESFISSSYNAIFYHFSNVKNRPSKCEIRFEREQDIQIHTDGNNILCVDGQIFDDPEGYDDNRGGSGQGGYHMKFSAHVAVQIDEGELSTEKGRLMIDNAGEFTIIASAATDYNPAIMNFDRSIDAEKTSMAILSRALETPYEVVRARHIKDHSQVYNRVSFRISDLEEDTIPTDRRIKNLSLNGNDNYLTQIFFQYGRYLLMSSSGGKARMPANLQGLWNNEIWARWESDYHLNINLQMNYWPADVCNLPGTFVPLSNFMFRLSEKGKKTARMFIGSDGWVAHHATNPFGRTTPSGSDASSQVNNGYCFPMAGAWMSLSLWRHFEFTGDTEYLRDTVYPVIRGASRFILDFLVENEKGELVTAPSYSPENSYIDPLSGNRIRNTVAAAIDIQIIRDVFHACLAAEQLLSENNLTEEIMAATDKLPAIKIGADGTIQEWYDDYEDAEPGHRHISHLFALYPSKQISVADPDLFDAARKTLEKRLREGGGQTGWSRAWVINFYARLLKGDECNFHITELIRDQVSPNLFDLHPPHTFQIDGNLGATAGIAEMLIQSHEEGTIRLLPALPSDWPEGHIEGIRTRGNFQVDIYWKNGELERANIVAIKGGKSKIVYRDTSVEFDLEESESFTFTPGGEV